MLVSSVPMYIFNGVIIDAVSMQRSNFHSMQKTKFKAKRKIINTRKCEIQWHKYMNKKEHRIVGLSRDQMNKCGFTRHQYIERRPYYIRNAYTKPLTYTHRHTNEPTEATVSVVYIRIHYLTKYFCCVSPSTPSHFIQHYPPYKCVPCWVRLSYECKYQINMLRFVELHANNWLLTEK